MPEAAGGSTIRHAASIVLAVYDPPLTALRSQLNAIADQTSDDWECIVVDDASTRGEVVEMLRTWVGFDPTRRRLIERSIERGDRSSNERRHRCRHRRRRDDLRPRRRHPSDRRSSVCSTTSTRTPTTTSSTPTSRSSTPTDGSSPTTSSPTTARAVISAITISRTSSPLDARRSATSASGPSTNRRRTTTSTSGSSSVPPPAGTRRRPHRRSALLLACDRRIERARRRREAGDGGRRRTVQPGGPRSARHRRNGTNGVVRRHPDDVGAPRDLDAATSVEVIEVDVSTTPADVNAAVAATDAAVIVLSPDADRFDAEWAAPLAIEAVATRRRSGRAASWSTRPTGPS